MAKTQILNYYINIQDADLFAQLQAQIDGAGSVAGPYTGPLLALPSGGVAFYRAPDGAAIEFAQMGGNPPFPLYNVEDTIPTPPGTGGYLSSPNFYTNNRYPKNVATFEQGGWWIFGETRFYWAGFPRYVPLPAAPVPPSPGVEPVDLADIPVRHALITGAQQDASDSFGSTATVIQSAQSLHVTRESSRLGGEFGLQMLNSSPGSPQEWRLQHDAATVQTRWERFNFRTPFAPSVMTGICRVRGTNTSGAGWGLAVMPTMQVALLDFSATSTFTLGGVFGDAMEVNKTYKFDVIYYIKGDPSSVVRIEVLRNGLPLLTASKSGSGALRISETNIGESLNVTTTAMFIFSDYICAEPPATRDQRIAAWDSGTAYTTGQFVRHNGFTYRALQNSTGQTPGTSPFAFWRKLKDSIDFQQGSHLQRVSPSAFSVNHGAWTGDVRMLMQKGGSTTLLDITSSTSGALCACETDLVNEVEAIPGFIGWVAAQVNAYSRRNGAGLNGTLGYKLGSAAAVDTTIVQSATNLWDGIVFSLPAGTTQPIDAGETLELRHGKGADGNAGFIACLHAIVEVIGRFGPEDDPVEEAPADPLPDNPLDDRYPNGLHNCQYPLSPWHLQRDALAPIIVRGGTYVGTGTGITLSFPLPVAWIMIRPSGGTTEPVIMWPTIMEGHNEHDQGGDWATRITAQKQDFDFVQGNPLSDQQLSFDLHIAGSNVAINTLATTYQYIAFMDPAARFSRAGVIVGHDTIAPFTHLLEDPEFTPEILFAWLEAGANLSTTGLHMQGPGHAAGTVQTLSAATNIASALTVAQGQLTVGAAWVSPSFEQYGYIGFRRQDGNNHPDEAKVMFLGSYVGDGTASRTVSLSPITGLRPLFAIVQPVNNATSVYRDPSHTTNTSMQMNSGGTITTGITGGGPDQFSVGSTLNANGVTYNYWGFYGSATAGNGGWSGNGEFIPVPADSPFPSDWVEPTIIEPPEPPDVVLVDEPDIDEDIVLLTAAINVGGLLGGQVCEVYTRKLVNIALSRIGITKQIANLATDQTELAVTARRHVKEDINAVLRDHPWAFATRYQNLVLHDGSIDDPFNNDWTFAYLAPNAMMFARRIAKLQKGRMFDAEPIAFRHYMSTTVGPLILCNAEASVEVPLVLEYTIRHDCPAFFGDAIFRDALAWRFAKSLASGLSRDSNKAEMCETMYRDVLSRAAVVVEREQQQEGNGDADWISGRN